MTLLSPPSKQLLFFSTLPISWLISRPLNIQQSGATTPTPRMFVSSETTSHQTQSCSPCLRSQCSTQIRLLFILRPCICSGCRHWNLLETAQELPTEWSRRSPNQQCLGRRQWCYQPINIAAGVSHPKIVTLINIIQQFNAEHESDLQQFTTGANPHRRRRTRTIERENSRHDQQLWWLQPFRLPEKGRQSIPVTTVYVCDHCVSYFKSMQQRLITKYMSFTLEHWCYNLHTNKLAHIPI